MTRRVMFYVQHLLGIGHLARASRIARALVEAGAEVTLVTGGLPVPGFPPPDLPRIALPPVSGGEGLVGLVDEAGRAVDAGFMERRRELLLAAFAALAPDVVVTEAFPFGRRQMRFELLPLLAAVRDRPGTRLVASVRDILQTKVKPGRVEEMAETVLAHYDLVLVHGDPTFAQLSDTFPLAHLIADRVRHTGLVTGPPPGPPAERFDVIVSAGGGAVGGALAQAALGAAALRPGRWLVITGPNLPQPAFDALAAAAPPGVTVTRFRSDFGSLLAGAGVSVSQAGYNTVGDILMAGCRSVLVPYATGGETEQAERAALLAARDRAVVLAEADLSPGALAAALDQVRAAPDPAAMPRPATDGAARSARAILDL